MQAAFFFARAENQVRAHFREPVGHLAAEAHSTASDDSDAAGEVEDFGGDHVASFGAGLIFRPFKIACVYIIC